MYASDLSSDDVGMDLTITVQGICTGGIIRSVKRIFGMVSVDLDGQVFVMDVDKPVEMAVPTSAQILTMPVEDRPIDHPSRQVSDRSNEFAGAF
jgi:hypothetical protein